MTSNTKRAVSNDPRGLIFAALIPLVACGLQLLLWDFFQPFVWFLFYPAVFLSSRVDGLRGGVVATLLATILAWYFFLPTPFSFGVESPVIFVSLGMFVGMGILFSLTHEQLRKINRRVAESLATSDLKLTAALASMTDAVFISDSEGRFIEFNEAFATFHKFRNKEECAKTLAEYPIFLDVFLPNGELAPLAQWAVPRALRGETVENAEYMLRRKDTGESWVGSYSFAPIRDKTGVIVGAVVTGRDITERRRVQEALNLERVRLDTVLKDMQCGVVLFDPDLTNCWMNPEALRIHGFSSLAEMYTRFDRYAQEWELSYPDGRTTPLEEWPVARSARGECFTNYELHLHHIQSGRACDVLYCGAVSRDANGKVERLTFSLLDVTSLRNAEQALLKLQRLSAESEKIGKVGGWEVNLDTGRLAWTAEVYRIHEVSTDFDPNLEEGINFYAPESKPIIEQAVKRAIENGERYALDLEIITAKGNRRNVHAIGEMDLKNRRLFGFFQDITERKQAEYANERARQRLNEAQRIGRIGDWEIDMVSQEITWSPQVFEILGRDPSLGPPKDLAEAAAMYDPASKALLDVKVARAIESGEPQDYELLALLPDGGKVHLQARAVPRRDNSGRVSGLYGIVQDITERKRAEKELQRTHDTLLQAQKIAHLGSFEFVAATRVTVWSEEEYRIYGLDPAKPSPTYDEMLARHIHPDDVALLHESFTKAMQSVAIYELEHRIVRPEGSVRWVYDLAHPYFDEQGELVRYVGTTLDITERKEAGEEIRKLNAELEQRVSERTAELELANKELESFSYSVSHDLRAPLRSIDGFSRIVIKQCADKLDDENRENLNRVRAASQRMGELIDDLLKLSRIGRAELRRTTFDFSALALEVITYLHEAEPARQVTCVVAPGLSATADRALLRVVLNNLLGNAWKFSGRQADGRIEFGAIEHDGEQVFFVRDNGAGFDPAYASKLFTPFQRLHTKHEFPGSGIGLATVQRIIHRHRGRVWAEAQVNQGATIYFTLSAKPNET